MTAPYGDGAVRLLEAGWRGPLPLPTGAKFPPPVGTTGAHAGWMSGPDVYATAEDQPDANVALRLPPTVIGLDVDAYDGKTGAATIADAERRHGPLPATWSVTSRADGVSGIRLYRVPPGRHWPGELGPHVEVIQTRHRYVVAPPSRHPNGGTYRWITPAGDAVDPHGTPPTPDDLAELPEAWVAGVSGGLAVDVAKGDVAPAAVADWYGAEHNADPNPCGIVRTTVSNALAELHGGARSRHDTGLRVVMRLCYLTAQGHRGVVAALDMVRGAWFQAVTTGTSARTDDEAAREWSAIMGGALAVLAADGALGPCDEPDPCANPLAGILLPEDAGLRPRADDGVHSVTAPAWEPPPAMDADAMAAALDGAIAREVFTLRVRREARRRVDNEETQRWFRPPADLDDIHTLADELLLPDVPIDWRVTDVFPVDSNVVLTAAFKSGKTSLVNHLVRCLVDGVPFLGRYAVHEPPGRVALWNYEVSEGMYRRWMRDLGIIHADHVSVLNLRGHRMPLLADFVQAWTVEWLKRHKVAVWVVDPFARALTGSGDENSNVDVGAFLEILDNIKAAAGVRELIMPTHTGRVEMAPGTERARGATRLDDWADVRWILTKADDGTRYFRASGRDVETEEAALEYDPVMRSLYLTDEPRPEPEPRPASRAAKSPENLFNALCAVIADEPGIGKEDLLKAVKGAGWQAKSDALARLVQQGMVVIQVQSWGRQAHFLKPGMGAES